MFILLLNAQSEAGGIRPAVVNGLQNTSCKLHCDMISDFTRYNAVSTNCQASGKPGQNWQNLMKAKYEEAYTRTFICTQGWRVVFFSMAGVAAGATVAVFLGGVEPRNLKAKAAVEDSERPGPLRALQKGTMIILKSTWTVFRIRSFQVILVAGIVGKPL